MGWGVVDCHKAWRPVRTWKMPVAVGKNSSNATNLLTITMVPELTKWKSEDTERWVFVRRRASWDLQRGKQNCLLPWVTYHPPIFVLLCIQLLSSNILYNIPPPPVIWNLSDTFWYLSRCKTVRIYITLSCPLCCFAKYCYLSRKSTFARATGEINILWAGVDGRLGTVSCYSIILRMNV